jgi:hypothetical protein
MASHNNENPADQSALGSDWQLIFGVTFKRNHMKTDFHIAFSYQEDIPEEIMSDLINTISVDGLVIKSEAREIGVFASMEWAIPTLIIAYLSRPYFEAFIKEAGKDHYQLLKKGIIQLLKKIFGAHPENRRSTRSELFSIIAQMHDGRSVKFIFPEGITFEEYEKSLDLLHDLISVHYIDYPNDQMSSLVRALKKPSHSVYLEYSNNEGGWILIDPLIEAQKARKDQEENNNQLNKDASR